MPPRVLRSVIAATAATALGLGLLTATATVAAAVGTVETVGKWGADSPRWTAAPPAEPINLNLVAIDTAGNLYQVDHAIQAIVKVSPSGSETVFAGRGTKPPSPTPTAATSISLGSGGKRIALDRQGNLFITAERRLLKVDSSGLLTLIAGGGSARPSPTPAPATSVELTGLSSMAISPEQVVYLSDISNGVIVRVDTAGMLEVVAGGGNLPPSKFATPATTVDLKDGLGFAQVSIALSPDGTLLLADEANNDIYKVALGMLTVIGYDPAHPTSIAVSPSGTVFLGGVERVNRLAPGGTVTALPVTFPVGFPTQVAHDGADNLYVTGWEGEIVRVQDPAGWATADADADGALNPVDNCSTVANADQANADGDALGDACDDIVDVANSSGYYKFVKALVAAKVTAGCGGTAEHLRFCPASNVSRGDMSIFLARAKLGPQGADALPAYQGGFADVTSQYYAKYVRYLADNQITSGCGGGNYCPTSPVTRGDMSIFLARTALGSSAAGALPGYTGGFTDVAPGDYYSKTVRWAKNAGITAGCGDGTTFCPTASVTREQMAIFLTRAFDLPVKAS